MRYVLSIVASVAYLYWLYRHLRPTERWNPYEMSEKWRRRQ